MTTIGPDVWIGQGAFVKAGVTIGPGAIVGARATVLQRRAALRHRGRDPGAGGTAALPGATVERLLRIAWWHYSIYDLFDAPMDSIEAALDTIEGSSADGLVKPYAGPVAGPADLANAESSRRRSGSGDLARAS